MTGRRVDADRLRELARLMRAPRGLDTTEQVPQVYEFDALVDSHTTGPNRVTLDRHGTLIPDVRYLAAYSPVDGDTVRARFVGDDLYVIGKFA